ncbi:unnamed protein product [Schistocephalus solidus]|uniref:DH domain-containing protein n=1 Tax=Schistocephalus solidus TaxID=70667 RepID=A0A183SDJ4_SCHSO|nr:unnamed protein product [Schistocephalus solidus]
MSADTGQITEQKEVPSIKPTEAITTVVRANGSLPPGGIIASCIVAKTPPTEIVNSVVTTVTKTDPSGKLLQTRTTTTRTTRTTTTVRRVCVVTPKDGAPITLDPTTIAVGNQGPLAICSLPKSGETGGNVAGSPPENLPPDAQLNLFPIPMDKNVPVVRFAQFSDTDAESTPTNVTQFAFMEPQTRTSEIVELATQRDDENLALMAIRDCERQFAAHLAVMSDRHGEGAKMFKGSESKKVTDPAPGSILSSFSSLLSDLPLYQGYGVIGQHVSKPIENTGNETTPALASIITTQPVDKPLNQLDASMLTKLFEEMTFLPSNFDNFFGGIEAHKKLSIDDKDTETGAMSVRRYLHCPSCLFSRPHAECANSRTPANAFKDEARQSQSIKRWRDACTNATVVKSCVNVASMTKHEIQLQEAMFEVITSEASYYRSLQVLINHFYSAPEFDCSRAQTMNPESSSGELETELGPETNASGCPTAASGAETSPTTAASSGLRKSPSKDSSGLRATRTGQASTDITGITGATGGATGSAATGTVGASTAGLPQKPVLSPTEKHHLFSNVLLVCMASEGQREDFQKVLARLHAHSDVGKNHLDSFLALPMQRLTRLKLLVEVIQKLQHCVLRDAEGSQGTGSTDTMVSGSNTARPQLRITKEQQESVEIALRELKRLLSESENAKQLMDQKARLLMLSNSLEFPETVKRIAISDKALIKEGELKCASFDGKASVLFKKLGRRKPESLYLILFDDILMVTKRKKNDRYLVQDYCARSKIYVTIGSPVDLNTCAATAAKTTQPSGGGGGNSSNHTPSAPSFTTIPRSFTMGAPTKRPKRPAANRDGTTAARYHTASPEVPDALFHTNASSPLAPFGVQTTEQQPAAVVGVTASSSTEASCDDISNCQAYSGSPPLSFGLASKPGSGFSLRRSGSSLSSRSMPVVGGGHINRNLPLLLYVYLGEGQNGTGSELCFAPTER